MTITEAAAATGMTRAAARRFLRTLCEEKLARTDGKYFELTAAVLELGSAYLTGMTELDTFREVLADLTAQFGESASAATLEGEDVVYVARSAARHRVMTTNLAVGTRLPAHATSMGQAILAELSHNELEEYFSRARLTAFTPSTITSKPALKERLAAVRANGYALVSEELEPGLRSIAVAVPGRSRHARLAINISSHVSRASEATMREAYLPELIRATDRVQLCGADISPMRLLIVYCHPCKESFNAAIFSVARSEAEKAGHEVRLIDLYASGFNPAMGAEERRRYHEAGANEELVTEHLALLRWCEGLVLVYPSWWYGPPAMLKGWIERVWVPHATFELQPPKPIGRVLTNIRLIGIVTTLGAPWRWWSLIIGDPGRILLRALCVLGSQKCRTFWLGLYRMDTADKTKRKQFLGKVANKFATLPR